MPALASKESGVHRLPPPCFNESGFSHVSAPGSPGSRTRLNFHTGSPDSSLKAPIQFFAPKSAPEGPTMMRSPKISGGIERYWPPAKFAIGWLHRSEPSAKIGRAHV